MADTEVTFFGTPKYQEEYGQSEPTLSANNVENLWNNEIKSNGNYGISIETKSGVEVNQTNSACDALASVQSHPLVQTELNTYDKDAVIVIDGRTYSGKVGCGYTNAVGGNYAVGYVSHQLPATAAHELGHIYGAEHGNFENFGMFSCTVMESNEKSCWNNDPQLWREMTYSDCTQSIIRARSVF